MMNFADLVLCLLTGFVVPLALASLVSDGALMAGGPVRAGWAARYAIQWSSALICGPGLFAMRLIDGWRSGRETPGQQITGWLAAGGWAVLYGYVVLTLVRRIFGV
jgi:uncharacterized membrane protein